MVVVFVGAFLFVWRERERIGLSFQFWTTLLKDPSKTHRKKSSKIIQCITRYYVVVTLSLGQQSPTQNRRRTQEDGRDEESLEKMH